MNAPVQATGAWTLNDSWATNIAALVAIVATVLGVSSAASELFPGADMGKFVVLIDIIGAIATAVPLLFAVLYTSWTARAPGLTEDASIWLTATLGRTTTACLLEPAEFKPARGRWRTGAASRTLQAGDSVILASGSRAMVSGTSKIALARRVTDATLVPGTVVTLRPGTRIRPAHEQQAQLSLPTKARLKGATVITLPKDTVITPLAAELVQLMTLPSAHAVHLPAGTEVTLPGNVTASVVHAAPADFLEGAAVKVTPEARITLVKDVDFAVVLPDQTTVTPARTTSAGLDADPADAGTIGGPQGIRAKLRRERDPNDPALPRLASISYGQGADLRVTSGATITVPWGATACAATIGDSGTQPARMDAGAAIGVPPGSDLRVYGGYLTVPGSSDILLRGDCILVIDNQSGAPGIGSAALGFPVRITVSSGAKISVNGVAQLNLPDQVTVTAPRRATFRLRAASSRTPVRVPQGTSTLVGPLWTVIAAAIVTTFSVGAQLGVAALLTTYLLGASTLEQSLTWLVAIVIGLFSVWYGVTAIRALADPQPGSCMSSTPGTSFTL